MNFISTFEELNKLYEEAIPENEKEEVVEESCVKEELTEAAEDEEIEIVDDEEVVVEAPADEAPAIEDEEPKRLIIECDKCGALVIKDEADIVAVEDSDLVNVEDECAFCEETAGYKIVGVVAPYETVEDEVENAEEAPVEELPAEDIEVVENLAEEDDPTAENN